MIQIICISCFCAIWGVVLIRRAPKWIEGNKARTNLVRGYFNAVERKDWIALQSVFESMTSEELERIVLRLDQLGPLQNYRSMGFRSRLRGDHQIHSSTYRVDYANGTIIEHFLIVTEGTETRITEHDASGKAIFQSSTRRSSSWLQNRLRYGITIGSTD